DEAVAAREAAVRTRTRMQQAHDAALRAREDLEAALAAAQAQRDEANAQRDEVLLAYRAQQRHVKSERAQEERAQEERAQEERAQEQRAQEERAGAERARADEPERTGQPEEPIGVRTMPAARTVMAELQRPRPANKLPFSIFDLWVIRILGTVAAACFILLLISILRVFI
ncbi:MAG: hypothetical protein KY433_04885, partial [Actinobacteria bacterium]|nr:hypothetical protein [Actinomycetota bacterium]